MSSSHRIWLVLGLSLSAIGAPVHAQSRTCALVFGPPAFVTTERGRFVQVELPLVTRVGGDTIVSGHEVTEIDSAGVVKLVPGGSYYHAGGLLRGTRFEPIPLPPGVTRMAYPQVLPTERGTRWYWSPWDSAKFAKGVPLLTAGLIAGQWAAVETTAVRADWDQTSGNVGRLPITSIAIPAARDLGDVAIFRATDRLQPAAVFPLRSIYVRAAVFNDVFILAAMRGGPLGNQLRLWRWRAGGDSSSVAISDPSTEQAHDPMLLSSGDNRLYVVWRAENRRENYLAFRSSNDAGLTWSAIQRVRASGSVLHFDAAIGDAEHLVIAATVATTDGTVVQAYDWFRGAWTSAAVPGPASRLGDPPLAISNPAVVRAVSDTVEIVWNSSSEQSVRKGQSRLVRSSGTRSCSSRSIGAEVSAREGRSAGVPPFLARGMDSLHHYEHWWYNETHRSHQTGRPPGPHDRDGVWRGPD